MPGSPGKRWRMASGNKAGKINFNFGVDILVEVCYSRISKGANLSPTTTANTLKGGDADASYTDISRVRLHGNGQDKKRKSPLCQVTIFGIYLRTK